MAIDKSLRQHYQSGEKVGPFQEQFENIAGKFAPAKEAIQEGLVAKAKNIDFGSIAKQAVKSKIQSAVLGKLGLSAINPYIGLASLLGNMFGWNTSDLMQGFAPGMKEPGQKQTQAQYEAARAARQTQSRIDSMLGRKAAGKSFSQKTLNELTMGSRPGFYDEIPTYDLDMYQKTKVPKTPTVITPHGLDETAKEDAFKESFAFEDIKGGPKGEVTTGPVTTAKNPMQMAREAEQAAEQAAKNAAIQEAVSQARGKSRGNGGGGGGGGYGGGGGKSPGGQGGWKGAKGGYVDRPLPGRNRYL